MISHFRVGRRVQKSLQISDIIEYNEVCLWDYKAGQDFCANLDVGIMAALEPKYPIIFLVTLGIEKPMQLLRSVNED